MLHILSQNDIATTAFNTYSYYSKFVFQIVTATVAFITTNFFQQLLSVFVTTYFQITLKYLYFGAVNFTCIFPAHLSQRAL